MKACLLISYAKADIFKMNQTAQFSEILGIKSKIDLFYPLWSASLAIRSGSREITTAPRFEIESRTINNIRGNPNGTEKEKKMKLFS